MKQMLKNIALRGVLVLGLATAASSPANLHAAAPVLPTGDWDCLISGNQQGLAQLRFVADGTIVGLELYVGTRQFKGGGVRNSPSGDNPRDPGAGGATTFTNNFGGARIAGNWLLTSSGRIIGYLSEFNRMISGTTTNFFTNSYSFRAVTVPGKRIVLSGHGELGSRVFRGIPWTNGPSISGRYGVIGRAGGFLFSEIFDLTPDVNPANFNRYDVVGTSGLASFSGSVIYSNQKRMAFETIGPAGDGFEIRTLLGRWNAVKGIGTIVGTSSAHSNETMRVEGIYVAPVE